jgi:glycosyltransferase involved in cell wall biosynthesis
MHISKKGNVNCEVWYLSDHGVKGDYDRQFGVKMKWDVPLLEGYKYRFLKNNSWRPGLYNGFWGLMNFELYTRLRELPKKSIVVIHSWNMFSNILAILAAKIFGHIVCLRSEAPLKHEIIKSKIKLLIRKIVLGKVLFKCVDWFLFIGVQNKLFYQFYGIKPDHLLFTPYAVNNEYFIQQARLWRGKENLVKMELNIPVEAKVILYSGKLIPKKNPLDLLNAFSSLNGVQQCYLIFMGDGELRQEMEDRIAEMSLTNVMITGFINQSEISKYYAIGDIYVMCSGTGETWGLSTNEAMNFGLPVLISDMTGNSDDLVRENGQVFRTNDIIDLLKHLSELLNKSNRDLSILGERSKEVIQEYSYDVIESAFHQLAGISK